MTLSPLLSPVDYSELPGWADETACGAYAAFRRCALHAETASKPYRTGSLGVKADAFADAFGEARAAAKHAEPRTFFERRFQPCRVSPSPASPGFVTGFYEPELPASRAGTERFRFPLYGRPDDLVDLDGPNRPADMDPYFVFGRATDEGIVEYFDREAIENGALAGSTPVIAWLEDKVDLFFAHVQGAARLDMEDGNVVRVTYAAKSGHPFTGPGGVLADLGEIPREKVTMQSIRAWFRANPHRTDEILWRNRSFIFFREVAVEDANGGPVAAAKVQLTAGRSIAVDRLLHTFGTPFYIDAPALTAFGAKPFRRLMIAQDTGSAIVGAARGDLFAGSGAEAGEIAGIVRHPADFYALVPRALLEGGLS
ncbi:MAG: murein transglycosylase A [Hyphomicrobiales bacterium]|nr:murein transglycosylase A [Hyphomicrobiales bacterium]